MKKTSKKKKKNSKLKTVKLIITLLIIAALGTGSYFVYDYMREKDYTITLVTDESSSETVTVIVSRNRIISALSEPEKEGYTFGGWYIDPEFNTPYDEETSIKGISSLYARMDIIRFNETFETAGGSIQSPILYDYGTSPIEPEYPEREDYLFSGWYTEEDTINRYYFDDIPNADITLYAGWVAVNDALIYSSLDSSNVAITGYKSGIPELLIIPDTIGGKQVYVVSDTAFNNCTQIRELVINEGINFYPGAFSGGSNINTLSLRMSATGISSIMYLFNANIPNNLKTIKVLEGTTSIPESAFLNCTKIENIYLPDGLQIIGNGAFSYCSALTEITIPDTVNTIGYGAFQECIGLKSIHLPASLTVIKENTFFKCSALETIILPSGLTRIESAAFSLCISLENIIIPNSVNTIGQHAFNQCASLTGITLSNNITAIPDFLFVNCEALESVIIPSGVTSIGNSVFTNCEELLTITLPDSLESIGSYAFSGCRKLNNVTIPSGVTIISDYTFSNCEIMTDVILSDNLTTIGNYAFSGCKALSNITLPASITAINSYAFIGCTALDTIIMEGAVPPTLNSTALSSVSAYLNIYVPEDAVTTYKAASVWSSYSSKISEA
jgi:uncharacterized repeat protein (TIGR02543 family)